MRGKSALFGFALAASASLALANLVPSAAAAPTAPAASAAASVATSPTVTNAPAVPAAPNNCPSQYVCGYTGTNYTGTRGALISDNPDLTQFPTPWEHVKSIWNSGVCEVWMYRWKNYDSAHNNYYRGFPSGTGLADLATQAPRLENHTWSNHFCTKN